MTLSMWRITTGGFAWSQSLNEPPQWTCAPIMTFSSNGQFVEELGYRNERAMPRPAISEAGARVMSMPSNTTAAGRVG